MLQLHHHTRVAVNRQGVFGRRDFLKGISSAAIAAGALSWSDLMTVHAADLRKRGRACILLWMQGGPSQFETFSPKPGHPNGGETKAIKTAVPGIEIAEGFPQVAAAMNDIAIIRSMNSKEGSHPRATFLLHTGYLPTATVKYPTLGAIAAHEIRQPDCELPAFVRIGGGRGPGGGDVGGGLLGAEYDAFAVPNPATMPTNTTIATNRTRFERRLGLLNSLEHDYERVASQEVADHRSLYEKASKMITSPQMTAFDLSKESQQMREGYGSGQFGAGCLLARRLVEAGVTFVEVQAGGWDTHDDNFNRTKKLAEEIDQPFAKLVSDLKDRGLLDTTLIIWMGEFGRTPTINPRGGRDHYPRAFNVALAGGGIRGGQVIGETDAAGTAVEKRAVEVPDLFQTFCKSLEIDPTKENMSSVGRPIKIVDGGTPVKELFG